MCKEPKYLILNFITLAIYNSEIYVLSLTAQVFLQEAAEDKVEIDEIEPHEIELRGHTHTHTAESESMSQLLCAVCGSFLGLF